MNLDAIQAALRLASLDGWLFYDHHHRDPIAAGILGLDPKAHITRRWYYFIPATGQPSKLVHRIEQSRLDTLPGVKTLYSSWQELHAGLASMLSGSTNIAMQYSPNNDIMYISMVDAGTVEFLRSLGKQIVSSADLVSQFEAVLTADQISTHAVAQQAIDTLLAEGWQQIARRLRPAQGSPSPYTEYDHVQWLSEAMRRQGLVWEDGPNVSVNANSSDSHYEPTATHAAPIRNGDFLLIDIWARVDSPQAVYYDITWTGVIGREPTAREQLVFETVRNARDAAISTVEQAFAQGRPIRGFEADDAARAVIRSAGFAEYFTHRTGHNIAHQIHGPGAHLDNLETHDDRRILPHTCFSVEPGIYLPEFGVRSEIDMLTSDTKAWVTGKIQRELVRI
ncbi:MAG TPA: M24 family metallopeptidase [Terracidiphilus sp.]|nr:M24 family metallopeptidase [Terracidiphilus sp.]